MDVPEGLTLRTIEYVTMQDLDAYIEKHLGRPWRLQQNGDMFSNGTMAYYEIYPDPEATAKVQAWLDSPLVQGVGRTHQPGFGESVEIYTNDILNELCNRGLFPEGDLTVEIEW